MPSFDYKKRLRFTITIGTKKFDEKGSDQIILQGYRATISVDNAGWVQMGTLRAKIFGMSVADMDAATSYPINIARETANTIVVTAIDGETESTVFAGNMVRAWPDYSAMPDVGFIIQAQSAVSAALDAVPPRSFRGPCKVSEIMRQIANSMGYSFENAGVDTVLSTVYLANTDLEQIRDLAQTANIEFNIDRGIFSIWPKGSYRNSSIPLISPDTGLVGYPQFDGTYLMFDTLYNPQVISGGLIEVKSDNKNALGTWQVLTMQHRLESEKPGGQWFSSIKAVSLNYYVQNR